MTINAEIDAAIRDSDLEAPARRVGRPHQEHPCRGPAPEIETEEAELARSTATTAMWSAYQETAALPRTGPAWWV
jgi:hypothetical protein